MSWMVGCNNATPSIMFFFRITFNTITSCLINHESINESLGSFQSVLNSLTCDLLGDVIDLYVGQHHKDCLGIPWLNIKLIFNDFNIFSDWFYGQNEGDSLIKLFGISDTRVVKFLSTVGVCIDKLDDTVNNIGDGI